MGRFTVKDLRETCDQYNGYLTECGSLKRVECGGRNGYQAVDVYSVNEDGARTNSGVDRNLEAGSSRECANAVSDFYNAEYRRINDKGDHAVYTK